MTTTKDSVSGRAAQRSRAQLAAIVRHAPVGIAMLDRSLRYVAASARWLREFGDGRELVGRHVDEAHPDLSDDCRRAHERALAGATETREEAAWTRADGTTTWIRWSTMPWTDAGGTIGGVIVTAEDITERKRGEQELARLRMELDELRARHVALQTAAAIAHELNQPLVAISSYCAAAQSLLRSGDLRVDRLQRAIEGGAAQVHRAANVMRELMRFLEHGDMRPEAVDLNEAVRRAVAVATADERRPLRVVLDLQEGLRSVHAVRLHVEKVLSNLVRNAIEAMRAAGVAQQAITITVRTTADDGMAEVSVRDEGPGLDAAAARRIFAPFFSTKPGGLGMGLAISRALVEADGGRLWLDLDAGPGATFRFTLPFAS
jgi:PAS domain S-box-containing protein